MTDPCERCGAAIDGVGNHLELEVGAEAGGADHLARDLCDGCADVVAEIIERADA